MDPDSTDQTGVPVFTYAVQNNDLDTVLSLIRHGVSVDELIANAGMTALMLAAKNADNDIVLALIDGNADPNRSDDYGNTALVNAAASGRAEIVLTLLAASADPNKNTRRGITPLIAAVMNKHADVVRILIEAGADADVSEFENNLSTLSIAASTGQSKIVTLLLQHGANPNKIDNNGLNALVHAVATGNIETVRAFLRHGVHPEISGRNRQTPLSWAVLRGDHDIVRLLLDSGSDPNLADAEGLLPLQIAEDNANPGLIDLLKRYGASADPAVANRALALLDGRPRGLPASWHVADPFDDKSRYYPSYATLTTVHDPPTTHRALLRSALEEQSQIFLILGRQDDWHEKLESALDDLYIGTQIVVQDSLVISGSIKVPYEIIRQPAGLIAGQDTTFLLGFRQCGDQILVIDAGGSSEQFRPSRILDINETIDLKWGC